MKKSVILASLLLTASLNAATFNIWSNFICQQSGNVVCGQVYNATASYNHLPTAWGWKKDTGSVHTASLPLNPEWIIEYSGSHGHSGCAIGTVNVVGDATEKFRFAVYHQTSYGQCPSTNSYPVTLTGFLP